MKKLLLFLVVFGYIGCGNSNSGDNLPSLAKSSISDSISVSLKDTVEIVLEDGEVLLRAKKQDFIHSRLDIVDREFIPKKNGFDLKFTLKNSTANVQNLLFHIEIPHIMIAKNSDRIDILNTQNYMVPVPRTIPKGEDASINLRANDPLTYPRGYSPVIVLKEKNFAIGASILTTFNKNHIALIQRIRHNDDSSWSMIFENSNKLAKADDPAGMKGFETKRLAPNQEEKFHITVRVADVSGDKENNWLTTLAPYKAFFDERFNGRRIVKRDTRPILGMTFSYTYPKQNSKEQHRSQYTQRGYGLSYFRDSNRAKEYAPTLKKKMQENGFERVVFWSVSGQYYGYPYFDLHDAQAAGVKNPNPMDLARTFNLPSQMFGTLLPNIQYIVKDIKREFENSGIDYGFWWGRSGQIPASAKEGGHILTNSEWNPKYIVDSNILKKKSHLNFAKEQLGYAMMYGAKEIGLDAFGHMAIDAQLPWIKEMKQLSKDKIKFMQEGIMCDYLHTEMSLFLQPENGWFNKLTQKHFTSPPLLADYLNPNAEVIVWAKHMDRAYMDLLRNWGFTPLLEIGDGEIDRIPFYHKSSKEKGVKVFIIGDSTTYNDHKPQTGWGEKEALGTYMSDSSKLYDEGAYGKTSVTYREAKHGHNWEKTKNLLLKESGKGAYLLIQFGHNDEHDAYSPEDFYNSVKEYVVWAKEHQITPILLTSVERRVDNNGDDIVDESHGVYPEEMRKLAEDEDVLLLDLQKKSLEEYRKIGTIEDVDQMVAPHKDKNDPSKGYDYEHFSLKGAKIVAGWVKELICQSQDQRLCSQFK